MHSKEILLFTSDLLIYELTNALLKSKKLPIDKLVESVKKFYNLPIEIIPTNLEISLMTVKISARYNITTYDAVYISLAKQLKCQLITANLKCHGKIKDGSVVDIANFAL